MSAALLSLGPPWRLMLAGVGETEADIESYVPLLASPSAFSPSLQ